MTRRESIAGGVVLGLLLGLLAVVWVWVLTAAQWERIA